MATKPKTVNYTDAQTATMAEMFSAEKPAVYTDAEALAVSMGKGVKSVVAKLSRMGLYKAKSYATKTGEAVEKKDATADAIGAVLSLTEAETESLTKANKTALKKIFTALANSKPIEPGDGNGE